MVIGFLILLLGAALVAYSLYDLRRVMGTQALGAGAAEEQRLQAMAGEMLAAAEEAAKAVDEKVGQLEALMGMVEGRMARLQHTAPEQTEPEVAPAPPAEDASMSRNRAKAWAVLKGIGSSSEARKHSGVERPARPSPGTGSERESLLGPLPQLEETKSHLYRRVYSLHDQGVDVTQIAKQVGLTKGEVQLILGLREMR